MLDRVSGCIFLSTASPGVSRGWEVGKHLGTESSPGITEGGQAGRLSTGVCMAVDRGETVLMVSGPGLRSSC